MVPQNVQLTCLSAVLWKFINKHRRTLDVRNLKYSS